MVQVPAAGAVGEGATLRTAQANIKAPDASAVGRFSAEPLGSRVSAGTPGGSAYVGPVGAFVRPNPVAVCVDVVPAHVGQDDVPCRVLAVLPLLTGGDRPYRRCVPQG